MELTLIINGNKHFEDATDSFPRKKEGCYNLSTATIVSFSCSILNRKYLTGYQLKATSYKQGPMQAGILGTKGKSRLRYEMYIIPSLHR